jgi:ATP-dependent protease ClpP protease subunit
MHTYRLAGVGAFVMLLAVAATGARADRLVLHDGKTIEGEIVAESDSAVTVEVAAIGSSLTTQVNKAQIKTWYKPVREGPPYVLIPIVGVIGDDVTADAVRAGLREALAAKPRYIVWAIDSPGGSIDTMMDIVDAIKGIPAGIEVIAYVKSAASAAAVIAMSCRQVYMLPGAVIGAAVPLQIVPGGLPADVDAKYRSFFEATIRAANEHGQHADLLIRGMSETDLEIYLSQVDGKPVLSTTGVGKRIKAKGQILSLTADEAAESGLAHPTTGMADVGKQVCGGPWYEVNRRAWNATIGTVAMQRQREREQLRRQQLLIAQRNAYTRIKPELDSIDTRLTALAAKAVAADNAIADLTAKCNRELVQIDADYQQALALARYQNDPNAWIAHAVEVRNTRASEARQYLQANVARLQSESDAARLEIRLLHDRQDQLLATVPSD